MSQVNLGEFLSHIVYLPYRVAFGKINKNLLYNKIDCPKFHDSNSTQHTLSFLNLICYHADKIFFLKCASYDTTRVVPECDVYTSVSLNFLLFISRWRLSNHPPHRVEKNGQGHPKKLTCEEKHTTDDAK